MADSAELIASPTLGKGASEAEARPGGAHRRTNDAVFRGALAVAVVITAIWLFFVVTGLEGGPVFNGYRVSREAVVRVVWGFSFVYLLWGWLWYGVKLLLLRRFVGLSRDETRAAFRSRMGTPFDLTALLQKYSERRIRITDMVGRRGRFLTMGLLGFWYIYVEVARAPKPSFMARGLQENLFDAIVFSWGMLAIYHSNGFLGRLAYGAQARIMDGTLARANCLTITTLWSLFKFFMVPLGLQIAAVFPPATYASVFAFIWISYLTSDGLSEIVGSLFGRQKLRVWGIGEVNRKSVAGTWACFLGSLGLCVAIVQANHLPPSWLGLALAVALSNTFFELVSPRGTDDFTMATANALVCWGFGLLVYG
jgi:hypothetical protein